MIGTVVIDEADEVVENENSDNNSESKEFSMIRNTLIIELLRVTFKLFQN